MRNVMRKHEIKEQTQSVPISVTPAETSLRKISPLTRIEREMLTTLSEMERWFEDTLHRPFYGFHRLPLASLRKSGDFVPLVDVFEEGNELVIKAELAGINREDIKVELAGTTLTLKGEKRGEEKVERKDFYRVEQTYGTFSRTLDLPEWINPDKVAASYKDGLLEIRIEKKGDAQKTVTVPIEG